MRYWCLFRQPTTMCSAGAYKPKPANDDVEAGLCLPMP